MEAINFVVRTGAGAVERGQVAVDAIVTKPRLHYALGHALQAYLRFRLVFAGAWGP